MMLNKAIPAEVYASMMNDVLKFINLYHSVGSDGRDASATIDEMCEIVDALCQKYSGYYYLEDDPNKDANFMWSLLAPHLRAFITQATMMERKKTAEVA